MNNRELSKISVMLALVKREFQEQRALFVYLPLAVTLLLVIQFTATVVSSYVNDVFLVRFHPLTSDGMQFELSGKVVKMSGTELRFYEEAHGTVLQFAVQPESHKAQNLDILYAGYSFIPVSDKSAIVIPDNASLLMMLYWAVMAFYFLMTLYQQRKTRSILFWNSMPVSDAQTIVSKLLAGIIGCQAVFLLSLLLLKVIMLLETLVYGSLYPIDVWQTLVEPSHIFSSYFTLLGHALLTMAWTLPVYAWLLLASAGSRSMPFAWAAGPLVLVIGIELILTQATAIGETVFRHVLPLFYFSHEQTDASKLPDMLNMELTLSAVLGLALVYAAIRFNRSEDV